MKISELIKIKLIAALYTIFCSFQVEEGEECRQCGFPLCVDHRVGCVERSQTILASVFKECSRKVEFDPIMIFFRAAPPAIVWSVLSSVSAG